MPVLVDKNGNMLAGEIAQDIFYKDIAIAGLTIADYYVYVSTGVSASEYTAIGIADVAGGGWDENLAIRLSNSNTLKLLSMRKASYTIASNTPPIRVYFVRTSRLTPLT